MTRALWKGAISFGLIYIPVELYPAEKSVSLDLDMLDKRDFSPVGYKRFNKVTGKTVEWENIVKGYEYEKGQYVVLTDEELKHANPKAAQTINLLAFVSIEDIPLMYFEKPYYLLPGVGGGKVYALLRETLHRAHKVGIGQVIIRSRQHLAAVLPQDEGLALITLRYMHEIRALDEENSSLMDTKTAGITKREIDMAVNLVEEMTEPWHPEQYKDTFHDDVMVLIKRKIAKKETHMVVTGESAEKIPPPPSNVVDLVKLLKQSLHGEKHKGDDAKVASVAKHKTSSPATHDEKKAQPKARKAVPRRRSIKKA